MTRDRVRPEAPLLTLRVAALDTETTGLNTARDRIVEIGAVAMNGPEILPEDRLRRLVNPGVPIPEQASRIHGVSDADVADAAPVGDAIDALLDYLDGRVIVGLSIGFDLAILEREAERAGRVWPSTPALDVALLAAALEPSMMDVSMEGLATWLGVELADRHSASGDALTSARIYGAMIDKLRRKGVRTLGEADALQRRSDALLQRQAQAGWSMGTAMSGPAAAPASPAQAIDSFLYRRRLADVMGAPPISITAAATLEQAARTMRDNSIGALIVEPLSGGGAGIVTERDLTSALAERGAQAASTMVGAVMSSPVVALPETAFLYRVIGRMARDRLRCIAALDASGAVAGVLSLRSLIHDRAFTTLALADRIEAAERAADLAAVQAELAPLASALLADQVDARDIAEVISVEGRAMTARAAEMAEREMIAAGAGPAPCPHCLLVLGSGGRGESLLAPDQDNAVIVDDAYDGDLDDAQDWWTRWAERLNDILDQAGVPLCKGGVMVRNRAWRKRAREWRAQIDQWTTEATPQNLLNIDIFYDFAAVSGAQRMADALRAYALDAARRSRGLVVALGQEAGRRGPALASFGRFRRTDNGRVDLKAGGLLPVVSGARVMALAHGLEALSTPRRLRGAIEAAGGAGQTDAENMIAAHELLMSLILRQQTEDIAAGARPTNLVDVDKFTRRERSELREALRSLEPMRDILQAAISSSR